MQHWRKPRLGLGFNLSMSGIAAFPRSKDLRDIFAAAPVDRIFWWKPTHPIWPRRRIGGRRNEPAYTAHTARVGAEVFAMSEAEFAAQTSANFDRLFTKAVG